MRSVLVTGHRGYIAGRLIPVLEQQGYRVNRFDGDVTMLNHWHDNLQRESPYAIIHLAAMNDLRECEKDRNRSFVVNYLSVIFAGMMAHSYGCKLVFTSTTTAGYFDTIYEVDRYNAEIALCFMRGLNKSILRLATVYGDSPIPTSAERGIINKWVNIAKSGAPLKVYREVINLTRDYVYIGDVTNRIVQSIDAPNGVYDICTGKLTTILGAATEISNMYGGHVELTDASGLYPVEIRSENIPYPRLLSDDIRWTSFRDGLRMTGNAS